MGVTTPDYYSILNQSGSFTVDGIDDVKEFRDTMVNKNHISEKIFFNFFPSSKTMGTKSTSFHTPLTVWDEVDSVL